MEKNTLRDILFEKYFQIEDGISVKSLNEKLSFIPETWNKLHVLCEKNIKLFDRYSSLEKIKIIEFNQRKYLILKLRIWKYVIIDLDRMENLPENEFKNIFNEEFFVNNFDEIKDKNDYFNFYHLQEYQGNIKELIDFYLENEIVLNLSSQVHCRLNHSQAWTYLFIDFANASVQLGFQTPDQTLYEQLFLNYDLTPCGMQDAVNKIGREKIKEIFSKVSNIKIPIEFIPLDLYKEYLSNDIEIKLTKNNTKI